MRGHQPGQIQLLSVTILGRLGKRADKSSGRPSNRHFRWLNRYWMNVRGECFPDLHKSHDFSTGHFYTPQAVSEYHRYETRDVINPSQHMSRRITVPITFSSWLWHTYVLERVHHFDIPCFFLPKRNMTIHEYDYNLRAWRENWENRLRTAEEKSFLGWVA